MIDVCFRLYIDFEKLTDTEQGNLTHEKSLRETGWIW